MTEPCTEKQTLERIEAGINDILRTLNGNGQIGIKTQVELNKTYFKLIGGIGGPIVIFLLARVIYDWIVK